MLRETERKFLIDGNYKQFVHESVRIIQGYLCSVPERTVRVRVKGDKAFITVKGIGDTTGVSRFEWEKEIPVEDAKALLEICEPGVIDKTRHLVKVGDHTYEVDEFYGDNEGLAIAEIELADENESFEKPSWLDREVTGDQRYYNSYLAKHPYKTW